MAATAAATEDPFATQRGPEDPAFQPQDSAVADGNAVVDGDATDPPVSPNTTGARRSSREWDASKVPPSQFQKRKGSVYAVPSSRDHHVDTHKTRDKAFHDKIKEKFSSKKT